MFERVAATKGPTLSNTAETVRRAARVRPFDYSDQQQQSAQTEVFNPLRSSWNIGNIAVQSPAERNRPRSTAVGGSEAGRHPGLPPWPIQAKLELGAVDDPLERDADRVAEQVMRMASPGAAARRPTAQPDAQVGVQSECFCGGTCAKCKARHDGEEHGRVQRSPAAPQISSMSSSSAGSRMDAPPSVHDVLNSPGQPLGQATRAFFEPRFGYDLSPIRVHTDEKAAESARAVNARAYTFGHRIVFGSERYLPGTSDGNRLLAHELAHVVQGAAQNGILRRNGLQAADEARLRVTIVEGLNARKTSAVDAVASAVERGDRTYLADLGLTSKQVDILLDNPETSAFKMTFGTAAELGVEKAIRFDPFLNRYVKRGPVGKVPRGVGKPDWRIETPSSSIPVDLMTPEQVEKKLEMWRRQWKRGKPKWYIEKSLNTTYQRPRPKRPIDTHQGPSMRTRTPPMDAHPGGMPKPQSPMDVHQGEMPKPQSPMDVHQGGMPKPQSPMDVHQGGMPKPQSPMDVHQGGMPKPQPPMDVHGVSGRTPSVSVKGRIGGMAAGIAAGALEALSVYLIQCSVERFENEQLERWWNALVPDIETAMERRRPDMEKILHDTQYRKTVYGNIHMEREEVLSWLHTRSGSFPRWALADLKFTGVDVSTENINRDDQSRLDSHIYGSMWYKPFTYSVAIAIPAQLVTPDIRRLHDQLAAIKDLLQSAGGQKTAGQLVALDQLNLALQATDFTPSGTSQQKTAAERFQITSAAIDESLSVLQGQDEEPAASANVQLGLAKARLNSMASRWLAMVGEGG